MGIYSITYIKVLKYELKQ